MTKFIKFKENKNQIDFEIIDCMADIINNIVNDMYGFYKEHNIDLVREFCNWPFSHNSKICMPLYVRISLLFENPFLWTSKLMIIYLREQMK